jgi:serine/threonine-protein kinase RsbW
MTRLPRTRRSCPSRADTSVPDFDYEAAELHISMGSEDLARLHPWLDRATEAVDMPKASLNGMHVALEEVVMNIAMHGFPTGDCGEVTIRLRVSQDAAVFVVEDAGRCFDPVAAPASKRRANLLETEVGGLGLTLLRHYCHDIHYERAGDLNRLTLRFPQQLALK